MRNGYYIMSGTRTPLAAIGLDTDALWPVPGSIITGGAHSISPGHMDGRVPLLDGV